MLTIIKKLDGYKTYLGTIALAILGISLKAGWIDAETAGAFGAIIAAFTGAAVRSAISKSGTGN